MSLLLLLAALLPGQGLGFVLNPTSSSRRIHADVTIAYGIPKMFRWLTDQYPQIMERVSDALPGEDDPSEWVDNLYLDMNGIIHQCTHANDGELVQSSMKEQFIRIFQFTDKVCKLVRPRRLIYLAVDGVAPRAKMNQQRARRFRSSMEREQLLRDVAEAGGDILSDDAFDSNCITPGTDFMFKLGVAFRAWLEHKRATDPFYQEPLVIFSGPDVAGEGEHKIMDFVRTEAAKPGWEQQLHHCFYGLDADLIMLSLVTHQPNFRLLREKLKVRRVRRSSFGAPSSKRTPRDPLEFSRYDFEILEVALLREMIELQLAQRDPKLNDPERLVDDFVFLCMLVGNDFLPHSPHLDILSGSLDLCLNLYRDLMPSLGGYLTDKHRIHLPRLELVFRALAAFEADYFHKRGTLEREPHYTDPDRYRSFYYRSKFGIDPKRDPAAVRNLAQAYVLGLFWCAQYYHCGVRSWDWFYPYLYAPLASDLVDLADLHFEYPSTNSRPFTPLMQLMSVLPPQSAKLLPTPYANLMTSGASELRDAYPNAFDVDPNGKTQPWEAVVLIPFLDEDLLIAELNKIDHQTMLSPAERKRNDVHNATVWYSRDPAGAFGPLASSMSQQPSTGRRRIEVMNTSPLPNAGERQSAAGSARRDRANTRPSPSPIRKKRKQKKGSESSSP